MTTITDTKLPAFPKAIQIKGFIDFLKTHLPECSQDLEIIGGKIANIFYNPESYCNILYRIKFRNRQTGKSYKQLFSGLLLADGNSPSAPSPELSNRYALYKKRIIESASLLNDNLQMLIQTFPVDQSLPWILDALAPAKVRKQLALTLQQPELSKSKIKITVLGYTPQMRSTFLYEAFKEGADADKPWLRVVGKMHAFKEPARQFASAWAFWQAAHKHVGLAKPLGYSAPLRLSFQEKVEGVRLGDLVSSPNFEQHMRQTAAYVAKLHRLDLPLTSYRRPKDEALVVKRWAKILTIVRPDLKRRIERLSTRLIADLEFRTQMSGAVHGDFQFTNVMVHKGDITLIDLDEIAYGDPLIDVGRMLSSLRTPSLRLFGNFSALEGARNAFLEEYLKHRPDDEQRVRLFEAASLLITAATPFCRQRPNWRKELPMILSEAEQSLKMARPRKKTFSQGIIPFKDQMKWAIEPIYMQALLDPFIRKSCGADLTACTIKKKQEKPHFYSIYYRLSGLKNKRKWRTTLQGIAYEKNRARHLYYRVCNLSKSLEGLALAPKIPLPIAYFPQISMLALEISKGIRFSTLIGTAEGVPAAIKTAESLHTLHNTRTNIHKKQPLSKDLRSIEKQIIAAAANSGFYKKSDKIFRFLKDKIETLPDKSSPVLRTVSPNNIRLLNDQIAFTNMEQLSLAHPFIDLGIFLARLTLLGILQDKKQACSEIARHFYETYAQKSSLLDNTPSLFEAAFLLDLACRENRKKPDSLVSQELLRAAEDRINPSQ